MLALLPLTCSFSPSAHTSGLHGLPGAVRQLRGRSVNAAEDGAWRSRPLVPELASTAAAAPEAERVPWDWKRFLRQSSKFVEAPSFLPVEPRALQPGDSFGELDLFPLDDVVMGGASLSSFDNARRKWAGEVTTLNSGGFVGVRSKSLSPPLDCSAATGVQLRLRASGAPLRYKFILRDSTDFNGICYTTSFDVGTPAGVLTRLLDGGVETVRVPFDSMVPTIFARTIPDATINLRNIVSVQFALSKFEYDGGLSPLFREGHFELDIVGISVY
jgi:hypothetical protein